jgi:hypothetical protein
MNEDRVRKVLEIEKRAQTLYESAVREADLLPRAAESESKKYLERAAAEARAEARRMMEEAWSKEECERIRTDADVEIRRMEALAQKNFDSAVGYIVAQVVGGGGE